MRASDQQARIKRQAIQSEYIDTVSARYADHSLRATEGASIVSVVNTVPIMSPYLVRLTNGERNLGWLLRTSLTMLLLWIGSCTLIWLRALRPNLSFRDVGSVFITLAGFPLTTLVITLSLAAFVFVTAQLTAMEAQSEQVALLRLANVSIATIFGCLVLGSIYRIRHWLAWLIGVCPYVLWLGCQSYTGFWALPSDLRTYVTLLGHSYVYRDGPIDLSRQLELFWFMSLTVGVLGLCYLAVVGSVGMTLKSKRAAHAAAVMLAITLPLILGLIILALPDGFLAADTAYGSAEVGASIRQILPAGIAIAAVPIIAALSTQQLFRHILD